MRSDVLTRLRSFVTALTRREQFEDTLSEELRFHLDACADDLIEKGLSRKEAYRQARVQFGSVERVRDECRQARGLRFLDDLRSDLRFGVRGLARNPGFTATAALTLSIGIGGTAAIFSLMDAVMWRMLPVDRPEELWMVGEEYTHREFRALTEDDTVLAGAAAYARARLNVSIDGNSEPPADGLLVSGGYFTLLGVTPIAGRAIGPEDDRLPNGHPVAMISDGYWSRRFGRDPATIGSTISISDTPFTLIGVTPPEFFGVEVGTSPDIYVPVMMQPTVMMATSPNLLTDPEARNARSGHIRRPPDA